MAREIDQDKLPRHTGRFSFDAEILKKAVKEVKDDYDPYDPKTWPVVTSDLIQQHLGREYYGHELLPPFVAYERKLIETCVLYHEDDIIEVVCKDGVTIKQMLYFHHFPFIYNRLNNPRPHEYMQATQYMTWVRAMTGMIPETRLKGRALSTTLTSERERSAAKDSSADAYQEVLDMISMDKSGTTRNVEGLQAQLQQAQAEIKELKTRAERSEKDSADMKISFEKRLADQTRRADAATQDKQTLRESFKAELAAEKARTEASKTKATADLEAAKQHYNEELKVAKEDTATAKTQVIKIRDAMKQAKRKHEGEGSHSKFKKAKVEDDD